MKISDSIRNNRKLKGLTQKQLAQKTHLSIATIQGYEQNKYLPKLEAAQRIAKVLDVNVDCILGKNTINNFTPDILRQNTKLDDILIKFVEDYIEFDGTFDIYSLTIEERSNLYNTVLSYVSYDSDYNNVDVYPLIDKQSISEVFTALSSENEIIKKYNLLNKKGKEKVNDYVSDIAKIPIYTDKD